MKVVYSECANRDLHRFREFMSQNDIQPETIGRVLDGLLHSIETLADLPLLGFSLSERRRIPLPYRILLANPYIVVYDVHSDAHSQVVEIIRIFHQKEDYIRTLIGNEPSTQRGRFFLCCVIEPSGV